MKRVNVTCSVDSFLSQRKQVTFDSGELISASLDTKAGRSERDRKFGSSYLSENSDFSGTHELGHILASTLIDTDNSKTANKQQNTHLKESSVMKSVFSNPDVMPEDYYKNLKRYTKKRLGKNAE